MNKYIKGGIAFIKGFLFSLTHKGIDKVLGIYSAAEIELERGSRCKFGRRVQFRERASIKVRKGAFAKLEKGVYVGAGSVIVCHDNIEIGERTLIAPYAQIYDHDHRFTPEEGVKPYEYVSSPVKIGKHCWRGANAVILRGTELGDNCVVGAGAVVKGKYPAGTKIIKK